MVQIIGLMIAAYATARLFDQAVPGGHWLPRAVAVVAILVVAFCVLLLLAVGNLSDMPFH